MDKIIFFSLRLGLFLLIANIIMLFITAPMSAEWIVSVILAVLMAILVVVAAVITRRRAKKDEGGDGNE